MASGLRRTRAPANDLKPDQKKNSSHLMHHSKTLYLTLPSCLRQVLAYFEVNCVASCCGLDAYDFDPIYASHALAANGSAFVESASDELASLIVQIRGLPEDWGVQSGEMNAVWSKTEALAFFEMIERDIRQGLEIGAVAPDDANPRNDPLQRFKR